MSINKALSMSTAQQLVEMGVIPADTQAAVSLSCDDMRSVAESVRRLASAYSTQQEHACVILSALGAQVIRRRFGVRAVFQAGSAFWQFRKVPPPDIDSYGYEYDESQPLSAARLREGKIPELHCWIALPDTGEFIDFTTGALPGLVRESTGFEWALPAPPDFYWGRPEAMPGGWFYTASMQAISRVMRCCMHAHRELAVAVNEGSAPLSYSS